MVQLPAELMYSKRIISLPVPADMSTWKSSVPTTELPCRLWKRAAGSVTGTAFAFGATVVTKNPPLTLFQPDATCEVLLARQVPGPKVGVFFQ